MAAIPKIPGSPTTLARLQACPRALDIPLPGCHPGPALPEGAFPALSFSLITTRPGEGVASTDSGAGRSGLRSGLLHILAGALEGTAKFSQPWSHP